MNSNREIAFNFEIEEILTLIISFFDNTPLNLLSRGEYWHNSSQNLSFLSTHIS